MYIGLYFLFFIWLFAFSGLMLNHPNWRFQQFWDQRELSSFQRPVRPPAGDTDLARAEDLMNQLDISGEVQWTANHPQPGRFDFRTTRPGRIIEVKADLQEGHADVNTIEVNAWGVLNMLHTFTGVPARDLRQERDWIWTKIWSLSIDAISAGLVFLVLSGYYMWFRRTSRRRPGLIFAVLALLACGFFLFGMGW